MIKIASSATRHFQQNKQIADLLKERQTDLIRMRN